MEGKSFKLCDCNGTAPIDGAGLAAMLGLDEALEVCHALCRQEIGRYTGELRGSADLIVSCTQEAPLFKELAEEAGFSGRLRFVNLREWAGWSEEGKEALPKMAALLTLAAMPDPEPVPALSCVSRGSLLIVGPAEVALEWAERLQEAFDLTVLVTSSRDGRLPERRAYPVRYGHSVAVSGSLGRFRVVWQQDNPIDLDLCTRCGACLRVCPEGAISPLYQIDAERCRGHRACVAACAGVGAIDFARRKATKEELFDLVFDLSVPALIRLPHPPHGYVAAGRDALDQALAALTLSGLVGEFEWPKYAQIDAGLCAHGRNRVPGCSRCIDVCSSAAIHSVGDHVEIDPWVCQGCGGCATVCPTGAVRYAYPRPADTAERLRRMLAAYAAAGGRDGCLLFHDAGRGRDVLMRLGREGRGLPARVIPFEVHDVAAIGLDVLLAAVVFGAVQCVVLYHPDAPEGYVEATRTQFGFGESILNGLGYGGRHFILMQTEDPVVLQNELWQLGPAESVAEAARFRLPEGKRRALEFSIEHLARHAPTPQETISLPAAAPFGTVHLAKDKCTLCLSCVSACPAQALRDAVDRPQLRFIERNCVQCGLCARTCPEAALSLESRLWLGVEAKRERVLNEAEPFHCVRCGKVFGTRQMIVAMLDRLGRHAMFAEDGSIRRLQMCADCRVIDLMENKASDPTVFDL